MPTCDPLYLSKSPQRLLSPRIAFINPSQISRAPLSSSSLVSKTHLHLPFRAASPRRRHTVALASSTTPAAMPSPLLKKYGPWALVTGASSGIGAEFVRQLAPHAFSIVLVARREHRLKALSATLATSGIKSLVVVADLTTQAGIQTVIDATADLEIGLLINNAGVEYHGSFFNTPPSEHRNMISLNITAVTEMAHIFGKKMCQRHRGGIIFTSSISAHGMPWLATYSSTKSYVTCLALTLRDELMRNGVDCMALEPGLVVSEMTLPDGEQPDDQTATLMPTDVCVSEALRVFGQKPVFTPGLANRVLKNILLMLPRPTALWLLSEYLLTKMDPESVKF